MELKNYSFLSEESSKHGAVGAIVYPHSGEQFYGSLMQDFEVLVLILHEEGPTENRYRHSAIGELRYQILYMDWMRLTRCLITGEDRGVVEAFYMAIYYGTRVTRLRFTEIIFNNSVQSSASKKYFMSSLSFCALIWMPRDGSKTEK